jgi:hypothetical protein
VQQTDEVESLENSRGQDALFMKLSHATVLALVGWYLMAPPIRPGGGVDLAAPISRWELKGDFGSVAACEEARAHQIDRAKTRAARIRGNLESNEEAAKSKSLPAQQADELNKWPNLIGTWKIQNSLKSAIP